MTTDLQEPERCHAPGSKSVRGIGAFGRKAAYILLAVSLGILAVLWVTNVEYRHQSIEIGCAVPPIPALRGGIRLETQNEPLSPRAAWGILILGPALMLLWLQAAGLPLGIGNLHLALLIAVAIVYARMRAETGTPLIYLFPFWQQQSLLYNFFGSQMLVSGSGSTLPILTSISGLSRGFYPEISAYGAEGMSLAAQARFPQRHVTLAYIGGAILGLVLGGWLYLTYCYQQGADQLGGQYQMNLMRQQYSHVAQMMRTATPPKGNLIFQTILGAGIAFALNGLRQSPRCKPITFTLPDQEYFARHIRARWNRNGG